MIHKKISDLAKNLAEDDDEEATLETETEKISVSILKVTIYTGLVEIFQILFIEIDLPFHFFAFTFHNSFLEIMKIVAILQLLPQKSKKAGFFFKCYLLA